MAAFLTGTFASPPKAGKGRLAGHSYGVVVKTWCGIWVLPFRLSWTGRDLVVAV